MASTNKTQNYELSQFIGTDKPAWLTDYNADMYEIDYELDRIDHSAQQAVGTANQAAAAVAGKQDVLTFDDVPTYGSNNPVKSGGIYNAIANINVQTDAVPTEGSTKAVQSGGVYDALAGKQNTLTFDDVPTSGSNNPVKSGGVYSALAGTKGWNVITVYPLLGSNNGSLIAASTVGEIQQLPAPIDPTKSYEYELIAEGLFVNDASKTDNYVLAVLNIGDSSMTSGTRKAINIQPTQVGAASASTFGRIRREWGISAPTGSIKLTNGAVVDNYQTQLKNNLESEAGGQQIVNPDISLATHYRVTSNSLSFYAKGFIFRYREL